jgi:molecular chaperone GrpE
MASMDPNQRKTDEQPARDAAAASQGGTAGSAAGQSPASEPNEVVRLRAELEEAKDRAMRGWAELENYRKRANRQIEEERRYAAVPLIRDLLPVLDNVNRAVEAADKSHDTASLLEGIKMVVQQLGGVLERHHCTPIASLGKPFDPNYHEAILRQPAADVAPNTVIQEVQPGFQLFDRVVRPSQVIVSSAVERPNAPASEGRDEKPNPPD